jgi:hypothetical protein
VRLEVHHPPAPSSFKGGGVIYNRMADVSWLLCCEEFVVKENGLCDAKDLLFELHTPTVPVVGKISVDVAAMWRTDGPAEEPPLTIRMAMIFADGTVQPSNETWTLTFTSPQVLWYKRVTDLYLHCYGFVSIAMQCLEDGNWITKREFPIMVMGGEE